MPRADSAATTTTQEAAAAPSCSASPLRTPPAPVRLGVPPGSCAKGHPARGLAQACTPTPPASHAHGRATCTGLTHARPAARRAGPCAAVARCPLPGSARPARGLADGSRAGAGERELPRGLKVRVGVGARAAGVGGSLAGRRGCCKRLWPCSGLPPCSSGRVFPKAWLDPALAGTCRPPADESTQIRVILGLRSQDATVLCLRV